MQYSALTKKTKWCQLLNDPILLYIFSLMWLSGIFNGSTIHKIYNMSDSFMRKGWCGKIRKHPKERTATKTMYKGGRRSVFMCVRWSEGLWWQVFRSKRICFFKRRSEQVPRWLVCSAMTGYMAVWWYGISHTNRQLGLLPIPPLRSHKPNYTIQRSQTFINTYGPYVRKRMIEKVI